MVSFFIVKWPPNLIGIATLEGNNGSESDEKLVPNIIDKNIGVVSFPLSLLVLLNLSISYGLLLLDRFLQKPVLDTLPLHLHLMIIEDASFASLSTSAACETSV